jgi:basic membrane protein A
VEEEIFLKKSVLALTTLLGLVALIVAGGSYAKTDVAAHPATVAAKQATFRVGLVTDIGGLNDRGFNQLAFTGVKQAKAKLKIQFKVLQSRTNADYIPNLASLAQDKYDLIIAVGFLMGDAMDTVATRFSDRHFAIIDVDQTGLKDRPTNVLGILFKEQEVGYLVGYLGALTEKARAGADVMGSVGGQKIPPVDRFIAGYQAGAKAADGGVTLLNGYSQDFTDQAKCKEIALNQIARGAHVVFQVAGGCGLGALDAAKEKAVWGIGVDADQSFLGSHILTSAQKKVDVAVFSTIKTAKAGKFRGNRNATFGVKNNGVGLGKIAKRVPKKFVTQVKAVQKRIAAGKIRIPTTVK